LLFANSDLGNNVAKLNVAEFDLPPAIEIYGEKNSNKLKGNVSCHLRVGLALAIGLALVICF
jgi:hypothetical protein